MSSKWKITIFKKEYYDGNTLFTYTAEREEPLHGEENVLDSWNTYSTEQAALKAAKERARNIERLNPKQSVASVVDYEPKRVR